MISALIIFPALSAMRVTGSFKFVVITSVLISVLCAGVGIVISILGSTPIGATIVVVNIIAFGICSLIGAFLK